MDLICLILWIIDLFKPSICLSIATISTSVVEILLLCVNKSKFRIGYLVSIAGIVIGIVQICTI